MERNHESGGAMELLVVRWKPIVGFVGIYSVSDGGDVRRDHCGQGTAGGLLKPHRERKGYLSVILRDRGRVHRCRIAALVLGAFIGERPKGMQINHRDGDKANNALTNLEYVTPQQNVAHAKGLGLYRGGGRYGEQNGSARLTNRKAEAIRRRASLGWSQRRLGQMYGVSHVAIGKIVRNETWQTT